MRRRGAGAGGTLTEALAGRGDVQGQLQRMLDIGVRLNTSGMLVTWLVPSWMRWSS